MPGPNPLTHHSSLITLHASRFTIHDSSYIRLLQVPLSRLLVGMSGPEQRLFLKGAPDQLHANWKTRLTESAWQ
jgi:hypothetical protein